MGRAFPVVSELIWGRGLVVGHPSMGLPPASVQKTSTSAEKQVPGVCASQAQGCPCSTLAPMAHKTSSLAWHTGPPPQGPRDSSSHISYNSSGISLSSLPLGICRPFTECLECHFSVGIPLLAPLWSHLYKAFPNALKLHTTL